MVSRSQIVTEARLWLGTPWQHQASLKGVGADCIGFVGGVALELGLPGTAEWRDDKLLHSYSRLPDPDVLLEGCRRFMDRIRIHEAILADVLIMRARRVAQPTHFALISRTDPRYIIHSRAERRVAEHRLDNGLASLVLYAFRFRGVS